MLSHTKYIKKHVRTRQVIKQKSSVLTDCCYKPVMKPVRHQRLWKIPQIALQSTSYRFGFPFLRIIKVGQPVRFSSIQSHFE